MLYGKYLIKTGSTLFNQISGFSHNFNVYQKTLKGRLRFGHTIFNSAEYQIVLYSEPPI